MYSTDCDSSEEEDDPKYCDSSSDESSESVNHQSTSEEEDAFFSSQNLNPLRIHDFFQVRKSMGISITHLVIYGGFSIPGPLFPLLSNYRP